MLLGKVLAEAAMQENKYVTWLPCYGAEVRGGAAYCMVTVSDQEIGSAHIEIADSLIIMNNPSLQRFKNRIKKGGLLFLNSSMADAPVKGNFTLLSHPFTDIASDLGNLKVANMVALGAYNFKTKIVATKTIIEVMQGMAPKNKPELLEINKKALLAIEGLLK